MTTFVDNSTPPSPFPCIVHHFNPFPRHTAYEYPNPNYSPTESPPNALIFIGGLFDGPHTVDYVTTIAAHLAAAKLPWSIFDIRMSSSFTGFGVCSLSGDCHEISLLVTYLRQRQGRRTVALMGHSTGCQDSMHYALTSDADSTSRAVDAYVLQGPASDREGLAMDVPASELASHVAAATHMIEAGRAQDLYPRFAPSSKLAFLPAMTAYRVRSLMARGGDDDYFSSDLEDETLRASFGRLRKPTLILQSENDQFIPPRVDKAGLVRKWAGFAAPGVVSPLSGLIAGANHEVHQDESRVWLADTVGEFLKGVGAG